MAGSFYYFISSLPYLRFPGAPPISRHEFLTQCEGHLPPDKFGALRGVSRVPRTDACCEVEARWNAWETFLRNVFVRLRASRRSQNPDEYVRPNNDAFADLEKQVIEAFDGTNPAEERQALDRLRWQKLNDLQVGHDFDFEYLVIYHLKLIILEKWADLSKDDGLAALDDVVEAKIPNLDVLEL